MPLLEALYFKKRRNVTLEIETSATKILTYLLPPIIVSLLKHLCLMLTVLVVDDTVDRGLRPVRPTEGIAGVRHGV